MVLSPAPARVASEYDYFQGAIAEGFRSRRSSASSTMICSALGPWLRSTPGWRRKKVQADPDPTGESVLCIRVQGTEDLELEHAVVDPSEGTMPLSPSKRQLFGLSTMGPATIAFRELRMSRGSLLSATSTANSCVA